MLVPLYLNSASFFAVIYGSTNNAVITFFSTDPRRSINHLCLKCEAMCVSDWEREKEAVSLCVREREYIYLLETNMSMCVKESVKICQSERDRDRERTSERERILYPLENCRNMFVKICYYVSESVCVGEGLWVWGCVWERERKKEREFNFAY